MAKIKLELPKNANYVDGWLLMTAEDLQKLVQSLKDSGVIPASSADSAHLEDMRRIAFSQLDIDHAQGISAVEKGADIVLAAMRRSGQIASAGLDDKEDEPMSINSDDGIASVGDEETAIPDMIIARSEKMAEQHGLAQVDDFLTSAGLAMDTVKPESQDD